MTIAGEHTFETPFHHVPGTATGTQERRLYRHSSLPADFLGHTYEVLETIPMGDLERNKKLTNVSCRGTKASCSRARNPSGHSGHSLRSRKASRAEYHEDLKPSLQHGLTLNLLFMSFVILIGTSFQFGYNIGVLNQPVELIKRFYNESYAERHGADTDEYTITFLWSLTTALYLPGGMIGAFSAGYLADRIGRKGAVIISNIPALVGAAISSLCIFAMSPELLMVGRFVTGLSCGMATQLAPMYLAEITPFNLRGAFGTANQLFITIGICLGSVLGLREILGTVTAWPYLLLLNGAPALLCLVLIPFIPDSPRYLMLNQRQRVAAEKALKFIRQVDDVSADMEEMETECPEEVEPKVKESYTMMRLLRTHELRIPLLVAIFLQIIQQMSGINAIFFYSTGIYKNAGVPEYAIQYAVVITNVVNVIMTIAAVPIMDKAGRRPLLLYPMIVMVVILASITGALKYQQTWPWLSYVSIGCVIAYVICFAVGLGPIPMMIGAELFRQAPRPRAMSLAGLVNWLFTAVLAMTFELIQKAIKEYTFLIFFGLMIIFVIFVYFIVPETKNKTFEEIASQFQPGDDLEVEEFIDDVFHPSCSKTPAFPAEDEKKYGSDLSPMVPPVCLADRAGDKSDVLPPRLETAVIAGHVQTRSYQLADGLGPASKNAGTETDTDWVVRF